MINVSQSFHRTSANAVDDTLTLTKAEMLAVNDNLMPSKYLTVCQDDGFIYLYDKSATPNGTTGKFTKFEGGSGVTNYNDLNNRPLIEGVTLTGNKTASDLGLAKTSDLPSVYEGDTAGLVPAAGSDNEGKYLDNDGNWTDPLENLVQNSGGKVLLDIPKNTYASYILAFNAIIDVLDTLSYEQLSSIVLRFGLNYFAFGRTQSNRSNYSFFQIYITSTENNYGLMRLLITAKDMGIHIGRWDFATSNTNPTYVNEDKSSAAQDSSIQLIDTSVSATMIGKINRSDIYDTTEKVVGKWTDGRPLYQKTIACSGLPNNTTKNFAHSISNISSIIDVHGIAYAASNPSDFFPLPYVGETSGTNYQGKVYANKTNVVVHTFTDWSTYNASVTLRYTKTTDAANSYNYADENDYSTSEKIIGKWIDGKTLYQKTIEITTGSSSATKSISTGIANISAIISADGFIQTSSQCIPMNTTWSSNEANVIFTVAPSDTTMVVKTGYSEWQNKTAYITLKYTKTS